MTTITLSERTKRNDDRYQVFGFHDGDDDRFVFGIKNFDAKADAETYARRMMDLHAADHFERIAQ